MIDRKDHAIQIEYPKELKLILVNWKGSRKFREVHLHICMYWSLEYFRDTRSCQIIRKANSSAPPLDTPMPMLIFRYDVDDSEDSCTNVTSCYFDLDIYNTENVVVEMYNNIPYDDANRMYVRCYTDPVFYLLYFLGVPCLIFSFVVLMSLCCYCCCLCGCCGCDRCCNPWYQQERRRLVNHDGETVLYGSVYS